MYVYLLPLEILYFVYYNNVGSPMLICSRRNWLPFGWGSPFDLSSNAVLHEESKGKRCNVMWTLAAKLFPVTDMSNRSKMKLHYFCLRPLCDCPWFWAIMSRISWFWYTTAKSWGLKDPKIVILFVSSSFRRKPQAINVHYEKRHGCSLAPGCFSFVIWLQIL